MRNRSAGYAARSKTQKRKDGCPVPSNELLSEIREAEAAAKALVEEAEASAATRRKDAEAEAASRVERAVRDAEDKAAASLEDARRKADALLREAETAALAEADKLSAAADKHMGEAVRLIIGGLETVCQ